METCCVGPLEIHREEFHDFTATVYEGRWGSVVDAVGQLLRVQGPLRAVWNEHAYGSAVAADRDGPDGRSVQIELVTAGVRS